MPGRTVATLAARVNLDASRYQRGAGQVSEANRRLVQNQRTVTRELNVATRAFNTNVQTLRSYATRALAAGTALVALGQRFANLGDEVAKMSQRTGVAVNELQTLQLAADSVGVPFNKMTKAIETLNLRVARLSGRSSILRTELQQFDPVLLQNISNIEDVGGAYDIVIARLTELQRLGRDQDALLVAQAVFGQGAAQPVLQVVRERETSRRTLLEAGALLSDEDSRTLEAVAQSFTDLAKILREQVLVLVARFGEELIKLNETIRGILSSILPVVGGTILGAAGGGFAGAALGGAAGAGFAAIRAISLRRQLAQQFARSGRGGSGAGDAIQDIVAGRSAEITTAGRRLGGALGGLTAGTYTFNELRDIQDFFATRVAAQTVVGRIERQGGGADEQFRAAVDRILQGPEAARAERAIAFATEIYGEGIVDQLLRDVNRPLLELAPFQSDRDNLIRDYNRRVLDELRGLFDETLTFLGGVGRAVATGTTTTGDAATAAATGPAGRTDEQRLRLLARRTFGDRILGGDLAAAQRAASRTEAAERRLLAQLRTQFEGPRTAAERAERSAFNASLSARARAELSPGELADRAAALRVTDDKVVTQAQQIAQLGKDIQSSFEAALPATRRLLIDTLDDAEGRWESFRNIILSIRNDLLATLAIDPLIGRFNAAVGDFIGGSGGGTNYNPVVNPGPGGPAGYANALAVPNSFRPPVVNQNTIIVNGVEDQAAFVRVRDAVEAELVPTVINTLAANANRPGNVRAIRGR